MAHDTIYGAAAAPGYGLDAPSRRKPTVRPDPCGDPCAPRCPACGGLECLCRPRFFPGQLLTDDALNHLIKYVLDKNKLHNRYLHGWGVACGLEVTCDGCDPAQVVVRTGYALSPCGDDIIVCKDQGVNICELIDDCRPQRQTVCDPPYDRPPRDCRGGNNRWVLAICYDERPSRGVTALLGAADTPCRQPCQCGGSAGCASCGGSGCGCGGGCGAGPGSCSPAKNAVQGKPRKIRQSECEPTQICEGYRFVVYPWPAKSDPTPMPNFDRTNSAGFMEQVLGWMFVNRARLGPLLERMLCCVARAQELLGTWGKGTKVDGLQAYDVYAQYAEAMYAFASEFTVHRCAFVDRTGDLYRNFTDFRNQLGAVDRLDPEQLAYVRGQLAAHDNALVEILSECFCAALLPPCPEAPASNCVPLAVVTLRANDCRVVDICNWEARKILVTWRTVGYWLSWIPWHCLRDVIAKFCCGNQRDGPVMQLLALILGFAVVGLFCGRSPRDETGAGTGADAGGNVGGGVGVPPPPLGHVAIGPNAPHAATPAPAIPTVGDVQAAKNADDLFLHLLDDFDRARSGTAVAPPWFALAARVVDGSLFDQLASIGGPAGVSGLRKEIAQLRDIVNTQQAQLNALANR